MLSTLSTLVHVIGQWLGAVANVMIGDQVDIAGNSIMTGGGPDGLSDFFAGLIMMVGTDGAGLGEVIDALANFLVAM